MLQLQNQLQKRFMIVADGITIISAFAVGYWIRNTFRQFYDFDLLPNIWFFKGLMPLESYRYLIFLIVPIWIFWLNVFGMYKSLRIDTFFDNAINILKATTAGAATLILFLYMAKTSTLAPRSLMILIPIITAITLVLERSFLNNLSQRMRRSLVNQRNLLIVGTGDRASEIADLFSEHLDWGYRVIGFLRFEENGPDRFHNLPILGSVETLSSLTHTMVIDHVLVSETQAYMKQTEESLLICEEEGVPCSVAADFFNLRLARTEFTDLDGLPLLSFTTTSRDATALFFKRILDLTLTSLALAVLMPTVFLLIAILIKLESKGPVFFSQIRSGLNGRTFKMYKFRSMVSNAEQLQQELEGRNEQSGPVFKILDDPRITHIGKFIRKTSIDELPQLFNIIAGHMSVVGPRPPVPSEVEKYERWQKRRLSMRPGLTCIWQVSGRNRIDFDEWMRLDLQYIDQWSFWLDIKLILKTFPVVFSMTGQ